MSVIEPNAELNVIGFAVDDVETHSSRGGEPCRDVYLHETDIVSWGY